MRTLLKALVTAFCLVIGSQALANPCPPGNPPTNCAPPTGAILDLNGTPIFHSYTQYTTDFIAVDTTTNLSFAFRDDPAFLYLDDVVLTLGGGPNLVTNGGFEDGPVGASAPAGWSFLNSFGATFAGLVANNNPHSGSNNYYDGAVQAYDGITQSIATIVGDDYSLSFWVAENGPDSTYSSVSTNGDVSDTGGNGIDLLVYAGAVPTLPASIPEPESVALLGLGIAALALVRRRSRV